MKKPLLILALLAALLVPTTALAQSATPTLSVSGESILEAEGLMPFTFTLSEAVDSDVTIRVQAKTSRQMATRGVDFEGTRAVITIPAGETTAVHNVVIIDDDERESDEVIRLKIRKIVGAELVVPPFPRALILDDDQVQDGGGALEPAATEFSLKVVHLNDTHSHLESDSFDIDIAGIETRSEVGGYSRVVTKVNELKTTSDIPVVTVNAGDAITGTLFYSLFRGQADAAMMNHVCWDIFELGNHEFDDGDANLAVFLNNIGGINNPASAACRTEILGANVIPAQGTPLYPGDDPNMFIKPFTVREYDGEQIGFVGIDIANKTQNSSSPLPTTQFLDELETAQTYVDLLTDEGINKIVLVTHIGYDFDLSIASQVEGVDAIIGGDSHSLLGNFGELGLNAVGEYPTVAADPAGSPVCVVQAWENALVVGELNIGWDGEGNVTDCNGTPHLLLGDEFEREPADGGDRVPVEGDELAELLAAVEATPELSIVEEDIFAVGTLAFFQDQVSDLVETEIGVVTEDLCLERIPGQGRSTICDVSETAVMGGDIQQAVTAGFLARSFEADIALQNAGGVRVDIPEGPLTIADAFELLPFSNTMVNMTMSGAEIAAVLEEAAAFALLPDGSTGAYPYASGLRWDVDLSAPEGSRFTNLEVRGRDATEWTPLDPAATYTVVTNSFIASGQDGYVTFGAVSDDGRAEDTFIEYAQSFIDYVTIDREGVLSRIPDDEYSTQSFVPAP